MNIVECKQGSQEWFDARAGRVTASDIGDAITLNKVGPRKGTGSAARDNLMALLVGEIMSGCANMDGYKSSYMERGTEWEGEARRAYEARYGVMVEQVGFVVHPSIERSGASPDGLIVGQRGGLEIKVPGIHTHIKYMRDGVLPKDYEPQVMWNLECAGYDWWDFISFCPEMPARHQIFCVRVTANAERQAEMREGVTGFLRDADALIVALNDRNPPLPEPLPEQRNSADGWLTDDEIDEAFDRMAASAEGEDAR